MFILLWRHYQRERKRESGLGGEGEKKREPRNRDRKKIPFFSSKRKVFQNEGGASLFETLRPEVIFS